VTLRRRLMLAGAAVVAVTVLVAAGLAYAVARHELRSQVDDVLREQARVVNRAVEHARHHDYGGMGNGGDQGNADDMALQGKGEGLEQAARWLPSPGRLRNVAAYVQLIDGKGNIKRAPSVAIPVTAEARAIAAGKRGEHWTDIHSGGEHLRVLSVPVGEGNAAQVADVDGQGVGGGAEVVAPDALEDRPALEHLARVAQEQLEQEELGLGQVDRPVAAADVARHGVEHEVGEAELLVGRLDPSQQRAQPRLQLAQRERLDQVVVGARVEAGDAVVDGVARGQHQDRGAIAAAAHAPADLEAVDAGHRHVEHDGVDGARCELIERLLAVARGPGVVCAPERAFERGADGRLVIDDEHLHGGHV